ncbi:MAG: alpha/beta hydrolase, partial [Pseudomonadota bacterium]
RLFEYMLRKSPPKEVIDQLPASVSHMLDNVKAFEGAADEELVLSRRDLDRYVETFRQTGFAGGINWYRNFDRNYALTEDVSYQIDRPCLMITAELDIFLRPELADKMPRLCPDLEMRMIEDCGHWTQWEKPDELNAILVDWLSRRFPSDSI